MKRPDDQERVAQLQQKFTKVSDGSRSRPGGSNPVPEHWVPSDPPVAPVACP
uniref:Uncharacterized protein n=1 Tax=Ficus carica TaxID=3494 RepID=A0AA88EJI1_FICCA|nr:hypothetical protein TIFTF001_056327 [Ficus carica]GMN75613.1 hypothetical protein TIFTF001_056330 [Ficus carica]